MQERRRFTRFPFDGEAHLEAAGVTLAVDLMDLSLKGALVSLTHVLELQPGDECRLTLLLEDSDIRIPLNGHVSHIDGDHAGVEFTRVDVEPAQHLRRLVELHLGEDPLP